MPTERPHIAHEARAADGTERYALHGLNSEDIETLHALLRDQNSRDRHLLAVAGEHEPTRNHVLDRIQRLEQLQLAMGYALQA